MIATPVEDRSDKLNEVGDIIMNSHGETIEVLKRYAEDIAQYRVKNLDLDKMVLTSPILQPKIERYNDDTNDTVVVYESLKVEYRDIKPEKYHHICDELERLASFAGVVSLHPGPKEITSAAEVLLARRSKKATSAFGVDILLGNLPVDILIQRKADAIHGKNVDQGIRIWVQGIRPRNKGELDFGMMSMRNPKDDDFRCRIGRQRNEPDVFPVSSVLECNLQEPQLSSTDLVSRADQMVRNLRLVLAGRWGPTMCFLDNMPRAGRVDRSIYAQVMKRSGFRSETRPDRKDAAKYKSLLEGPIAKLADKSYHISTCVGRALSMYEESILRSDIEAILFATIGLETLFSVATEQELRLKVALRVATLLGMSNPKHERVTRSRVFDCVFNAYKIRSKFVHGGDVGANKARSLVSKVSEYLRRSILVWLQLNCTSKNDMINLNKALEQALIIERVGDEVREIIGTPIL